MVEKEIEKLRELRDSIGKPVNLKFLEYAVTYVIPEDEEGNKEVSQKKVHFDERILQDILTNRFCDPFLRLEFVSVRTKQGLELLVPFKYFNHLEMFSGGGIRYYCVLDEISANGLKISRGEWVSCSDELYDGREDSVTYPRMTRRACEYDKRLHGIKGNLKSLLGSRDSIF